MMVWKQTETFSSSVKEDKYCALDGIRGNLIWLQTQQEAEH
jgi:hypothetical protein